MSKRPISRPASISRPGGTAQWNSALKRVTRSPVCSGFTCSRKVEKRPMTLRALSDSATSKNCSNGTPASAERFSHKSRVNSSGSTSLFSAVSTRQSSSLNVALVVSLSSASSSDFEDRKSTRLNSSHANISYAVFCLKKKKKNNNKKSKSK